MRQFPAHNKAQKYTHRQSDHSILAAASNHWSSAAISQSVQIGIGLEFNNIDFV